MICCVILKKRCYCLHVATPIMDVAAKIVFAKFVGARRLKEETLLMLLERLELINKEDWILCDYYFCCFLL